MSASFSLLLYVYIYTNTYYNLPWWWSPCWWGKTSLNCHKRACCSSARWYMSTENHGGWCQLGKLPICPPECSLAILPVEPSSSKSKGSGQKKWWFCLRNISFIHVEFFYMPQNLKTCGRRLYVPSKGRHAVDFLLPLKINRLDQVWTAKLGSSGMYTNHYTTEETTLPF
jgi:hypothetical protein